MNKSQEVKLLVERTVNIERLKIRVQNLCDNIFGGAKWEADKELIEDIFFILDPAKLVRKEIKLRYGEYVLPMDLFDLRHTSIHQQLPTILDKRDTDMVYSFRDIVQFDLSIIVEIIKTSLITKQYHMIPPYILITLAACHLELPAALRWKFRDSWREYTSLEKKHPLVNNQQESQEITYKAMPVEQHGLLPFSRIKHQEEKKLEYEKRQERLNNREAHKIPENTDKEQAG